MNFIEGIQLMLGYLLVVLLVCYPGELLQILSFHTDRLTTRKEAASFGTCLWVAIIAFLSLSIILF